MGFRSGAYASVFSVKKGNGNFYDVNITTSRKDKASGDYVRDFGAFVRFVGEAANVVARFDGKSSKDNGHRPLARLKLGDVDTTNTYNADKKLTYTNHVVFTCEEVDGASVNGGVPNTNSANNTKSVDDYVNAGGNEDELFT